jgi:signal transduction histidine kinase
MESGVIYMSSADERIRQYLLIHTNEMMNYWLDKVIFEQHDPSKNLVLQNGQTMFQLVIQYITGKITMDHIQKLAEKVALERVKLNVNIGGLVHNVSLGRSTLLNHLPFMELSTTELQLAIEGINQCFDTFLYHAITRYTQLKNTDLEEKKLFIERTHKERLTILGQMSSSFVHEFRNPLTSIMGFLKLLKNRYPTIEYLDIMSHELEQLNFRISQFLLVSKKEVSEEIKSLFNLKELIEETLEFLYPSIADGEVDACADLDPTLNVFASRNQIRQIIINLMVNSIDALQHQSDRRKLFINAYHEDDQIIVSISNNGPQIPSELIKTIFEPFVTTKDLGTGLGLYVCKQIMEKHQGYIRCESNDSLTTFTIHFPFPEQNKALLL